MKILKEKINIFILVFFIISVFLTGLFVGYTRSQEKIGEYLEEFKPIRKGGEKFKYINPLVGVESPNIFNVGMRKDVQAKLQTITNDFKKRGLEDYAIYYRDLNTSVWFGINDDEEFFPASLLKLAIVLSAYKYGEDNHEYLNSKVVLTQRIKSIGATRSNDETTLKVGEKYTIKQLIEIMIINSDNVARDLLISTIPDKYLELPYTYLNISEPDPQLNFKISLHNYALFFRLLYSSTFISPEHSEELLAILTKTNFNYGIRKNIPENVIIAHKFGVVNLPKNSKGESPQQLHECGVVYKSNNPFLLCVMTQGLDQSVLADYIATISQEIYATDILPK